MLDETKVYSWQFLSEMVGWAKYVALAVAIAGFLVTRNYKFLISFVIASSFDILTLFGIVEKGKELLADDFEKGGSTVFVLVASRLGAKALLLAIAAFIPQTFDLWGMILGVLVVDTTILGIGTIKSVLQVWR